MNIDWNKKTNLPIIEFTEDDFSDAAHIAEMKEGHFTCRKCSTVNEAPAWKTLQGYYEQIRKAIEELGKSNARSRAKKDLCSGVFSMLDGFDMAIEIPKRIELQLEMLNDQKRKKEKD